MAARTQSSLAREARRDALRQSPSVIGLDWAEVADTRGPWTILLHFVPHLPAPARYDPKALVGSIRVANVRLQTAGGADAGFRVERVAWDAPEPDVLRVYAWPPSTATEWNGALRVRLVDLPQVDPFFDGCTFRVAPVPEVSPSAPATAPDAEGEPPQIDYTARDFNALCQVMFDRMSLVDPAWTERHVADTGVALVEALAYVGDRMSYYQDAVATEAYLSRARRRISVRRHARLLDYSLGEGCNARAWVRFEVAQDLTLPRGTRVVAGAPATDAAIPTAAWTETARRGGMTVFETMSDAHLAKAESAGRQLYDWGAPEHVLPAGATSAVLTGPPRGLRAGAVLLLEGPGAATPASGDPESRAWAVRLVGDPVAKRDALLGQDLTEVRWSAADAPPFDLVATARGADGRVVRGLTSVWTNVVLADHGETTEEQMSVIHGRAALSRSDLTFSQPLPGDGGGLRAAGELGRQSASLAVPQVRLTELDPWLTTAPPGKSAPAPAAPAWSMPGAVEHAWTLRPDLLSSGPFARDYVVEVDDRRRASLRFGDGSMGRRPQDGARMRARYRTGNGAAGNVGRDTLRNVVTDLPVTRVTNPIAASGGAEPEDIENARRSAPAQRTREVRCVLPEDYVALALALGDVAMAAADVQLIGARTIVRLYVDRAADQPIDDAFLGQVWAAVAPHGLAGTALSVLPPRLVPLRIRLHVLAASDADTALLTARLYRSLGARLGMGTDDGVQPLGFGEPVYLSDLVSLALGAPGVRAVEAIEFGRASHREREALRLGVIPIEPTELARVANDPREQERGTLRIDVLEGS